ncbi:hypothetical protein [Pseudomonas sp. URMO17WK12:I11]|uniref:hypothetical protein n=1 Tax=Pseudomonas sp. URMO17WK12:I11 TaxID=1283291 RepID=UPI0011A5DE0B|nr:hypothetical protein [Pseudomonas sp. URMO17WK12:I11]
MIKYASCAFFLALAGCGDSNTNVEKPSIRFELDAPVENAFSGSSVQFQKDCMVGLCMYKYSLTFSEPLRADLEMVSDAGSLKFDDVVSTKLTTFESDTVTSANVTLGGVKPDAEHTEAMMYHAQLLDTLRAEGWRRFILQDEARIPGTEAQKFKLYYVLDKPVGTGPWNDPELRLTQEAWLSKRTLSNWYLQKDGVYLVLRVLRWDSESVPEKKASYLFTLEFESESEFYKDYFEGDDREHWSTLLSAELKRMAQERAQTEARLKKMGIAIDEDYQDPPIKALE